MRVREGGVRIGLGRCGQRAGAGSDLSIDIVDCDAQRASLAHRRLASHIAPSPVLTQRSGASLFRVKRDRAR